MNNFRKLLKEIDEIVANITKEEIYAAINLIEKYDREHMWDEYYDYSYKTENAIENICDEVFECPSYSNEYLNESLFKSKEKKISVAIHSKEAA